MAQKKIGATSNSIGAVPAAATKTSARTPSALLAGAHNLKMLTFIKPASCQQEVRSVQSEPPSGGAYDEVCGTPYSVETGGGFAEVVQDCEYHVYDDYCSYEAQAWALIAT